MGAIGFHFPSMTIPTERTSAKMETLLFVSAIATIVNLYVSLRANHDHDDDDDDSAVIGF